MSEQIELQEIKKQEPVFVNLNLTLEQVNFVLNSLGKLPTETGAWIVRQIIANQAQTQVDSMQPKEELEKEKTKIQ